MFPMRMAELEKAELRISTGILKVFPNFLQTWIFFNSTRMAASCRAHSSEAHCKCYDDLSLKVQSCATPAGICTSVIVWMGSPERKLARRDQENLSFLSPLCRSLNFLWLETDRLL